jgi:hypothetical protein
MVSISSTKNLKTPNKDMSNTAWATLQNSAKSRESGENSKSFEQSEYIAAIEVERDSP